MTYYLTAPLNSNWLDVWCDDVVTAGLTHTVQHVKRLRGKSEAPLFVHDPKLRNPRFDQISSYVLEQSEDLDELITIAPVYAL